YLTMSAGRPMCPSEQVDQVWHLHLTYTRSYWERFCRHVLGCPLHHEPTRGGPAEGRKHWAMYADTLMAYREAFGEEPPTDLWPRWERGFGDALGATKVNGKESWLVRKPRLRRSAVLAGATAAIAALAAGCAGNPFDLKGIAYLPFFFIAWGVAFAIGLLI